MNDRVTVSKTLDGWTVFLWRGLTPIKKTSPAIHGKLTKREAIEIANVVSAQEGNLPVIAE